VSGYLAEIDLREPGGVEEAIDELISCLKSGYYLRWDAVVREEHGLELREAHEEALEELSFFGDEDRALSTPGTVPDRHCEVRGGVQRLASSC